MLQYLIYFVAGGSLVALVAYFGSRGNGILAAFIASLPILFFLNVLLMYHTGGISASVTYAKSSLLFLPAFVLYAGVTIWLLPRIGPFALPSTLPVYAANLLLMRKIGQSNLRAQEDTSVNP